MIRSDRPWGHRVVLTALFALILAACGAGTGSGADTTAAGSGSDATADATNGDGATTTPSRESDGRSLLTDNVATATGPWPTDFSNATIDVSELALGIPTVDPRDAIPPIDEPEFEPLDAAADWLADREPGVMIRIDGEARFYALSILTRHEIVNDEIGGIPVAVTYCPLCNTGIVFDRRVDGNVLRFGVSGLLRNSDLVMWDDQSTSLWQQVTGEAIVGAAAGTRLVPLPSAIVAFSEFAETNPDGVSLSRNTGFGISYGSNPYVEYSSRPAPYAFFTGEIDERFPALERVVGVSIEAGDKAYPFSVISSAGVVNDAIGDTPIVVFWGGETADALDSSRIAEGQAVGTAIAFDPVVDGDVLSFTAAGDTFTDDTTGSTWSHLGVALDGPLAGTRLETLVHRNEFWFAWTAFFPDAPVYEG